MRRCRRQAGCEPESTEGRALRLRGWGGCGAAASTRSRTASDEDDEVSEHCMQSSAALASWPDGLLEFRFRSAGFLCVLFSVYEHCLSVWGDVVGPTRFYPWPLSQVIHTVQGPCSPHVYIKSYIRRARVSTFIA